MLIQPSQILISEFLCLFCISNTVSCLHQEKRFQELKKEFGTSFAFHGSALRGKAASQELMFCTSLIAVVCWETLVDCSIFIHYYLSCLLVCLDLLFGLVWSFLWVVWFVWVCCSYRFIFMFDAPYVSWTLASAFPGSSHENWHSILRNGLKKLGTGRVVYGWSTIGFPLVRPH